MGDPFDVLHVAPGAPIEVITAAYRALAKLHHPDRNGDTSRMAASVLASTAEEQHASRDSCDHVQPSSQRRRAVRPRQRPRSLPLQSCQRSATAVAGSGVG